VSFIQGSEAVNFSIISILQFIPVLMNPKNIRKLPIRLPRQPLVNQQPWLIAGLLLVIIIFLIAIYCYFAGA
jgi:hypothetical protein